MRGAINKPIFKQLMQEQDYFLVQSQMIRYEYTYFVCFQSLPEHAAHFSRPSFQSHSTTFHDTTTHRSTYTSYRDTQSQYQMRHDRRQKQYTGRDAQSYQSESMYDERFTNQSRMKSARMMPKTSGGRKNGGSSAMQ